MNEYLIVSKDDVSNGKFLSYIYFHGALESEMGYDLVESIGDSLYNEIMSALGEVKTHVLINGEFKPVIMYLWTPKESIHRRGLICFEDDVESVEYAKEKQRARVLYL